MATEKHCSNSYLQKLKQKSTSKTKGCHSTKVVGYSVDWQSHYISLLLVVVVVVGVVFLHDKQTSKKSNHDNSHGL